MANARRLWLQLAARWARSRHALSFIAGLGLGGGGATAAAWQLPAERPRHDEGAAPSSTAASAAAAAALAAVTGGSPPAGLYHRVSDRFVAEYDALHRVPRFVAERLDRAWLGAAVASRGDASFRADPALPPHLRASAGAYAGSGYDRGHLAPAANHRASEAALADTFLHSNIAPQVGAGFNRDYWARLERFTRELTRAVAGDVHVVTGPLFLPAWRPQALAAGEPRGGGGRGAREGAHSGGPRRDLGGGGAHGDESEAGAEEEEEAAAVAGRDDGRAAAAAPAGGGHWEYRYPALGGALRWVGVPTHFYKAVLAEGDGGGPLVAAFILPNEPIAPGRPLTDFLVPLSALEHAGGLSLWRSQLDAEARAACDAEALRIAGGGSVEGGVRKLRRALFGPSYAGPLPPAVAAPLAAVARGGGGAGGGGAGGGEPAPAPARAAFHLCSVVACALPASAAGGEPASAPAVAAAAKPRRAGAGHAASHADAAAGAAAAARETSLEAAVAGALAPRPR